MDPSADLHVEVEMRVGKVMYSKQANSNTRFDLYKIGTKDLSLVMICETPSNATSFYHGIQIS
jgi:hypothetical protein